MYDRAGPFLGTQVDKPRERPNSRDTLLGWYCPAPRVNRRGNHARPAASSSSDYGRWCFASERPKLVGDGIDEVTLRVCCPLFLKTRPNGRARRLKKLLGPALGARLIQVVSVIGLEPIQNSRRHQFRTKTRRNGISVSDFCSDKRNYR